MRNATNVHRNDLTLMRYEDLVAEKIVKNRTTLRRWMARDVDPFPAAIVLTRSARQNAAIAWRRSEVETWLESRETSRAES
jgi:predicted DNA-binding transcriptional regulator AlpA